MHTQYSTFILTLSLPIPLRLYTLPYWSNPPFLLCPGRGAEYCDQPICLCICLCVYLYASISLKQLDQSTRNFVCRFPVAVAQSSSGGVALRYVFPVLWMMSHLAAMGRMSVHRLSVAKYYAPRGVVRPGRSLTSRSALLIFDIWALWHLELSARVHKCQKENGWLDRYGDGPFKQ